MPRSHPSPLAPASLPSCLQGEVARGIIAPHSVAVFEQGEFDARGRRLRDPMRNLVYLVIDWPTRRAAWVDPAWPAGPVASALGEHGLTLEAIWLTHAHPDHVSGLVGALETSRQSGREPQLVWGEAERLHWQGSDLESTFEAALARGSGRAIASATTLSVGSLSIQALPTPGHSPGSLCFGWTDGATSERYLIGGDTLFVDDCGRTDLAGGSDAELFASLQTLAALDARTILLPGHHYRPALASRLGEQLMTNRALRCRSVEEFAALP